MAGTDIKEIDYDQIIVKASQIANSANDMQNAIKGAFAEIQQMSDVWFGNSYDNFINVVNMAIPGLNKVFTVTVRVIYHMKLQQRLDLMQQQTNLVLLAVYLIKLLLYYQMYQRQIKELNLDLDQLMYVHVKKL